MSDETTQILSPSAPAVPAAPPAVAQSGSADDPPPATPASPPGPEAGQSPQSPQPLPSTPPVPPAQPPDAAPLGSPVPPTPPGRGRRAVAVLTATGLMLVSATGGALLALGLDDDDSTRPVATSLNAAPAVDGGDTEPDEPLSQAAAAVLPSVVSITVESGRLNGSGSGIVISEDGEILTNNHVVAAAADGGDLSVTFSDGRSATAEIVGRDPATDLAVIKAQDVSGLTPATFGSSADLHVGDTVLAIGSPLGLDGSVSAGIVSALNRAITLQGDVPESPFGGGGESSGPSPAAVIDAIQTDAAINPGNSGGALTNADGEVVGVNTAIASLAQGPTSQGGNIGVGFAIPIDDARSIAEQLVETGSVTHAYLGVRIADGEPGTGALVGGVEEGQPAAEAGLQEGDVVTKVDDAEVSDAAGLTAAIRSHEPGDKVTITFNRDGSEQTTEVTLGELPE
jgi:putative serine protease PepD